MAQEWYLHKDGNPIGPIGVEDLARTIASGDVKDSDVIWSRGMRTWAYIGALPELSRMLPRKFTPSPVPKQIGNSSIRLRKLAWIVFALAIFTTFGTTYFLLGGKAALNHFLKPNLITIKNEAENGKPQAQTLLGEALLKGKEITKNPEEAIRWFSKAADNGYGPAQAELGSAYLYGVGVKKDLIKSLGWIQLAVEKDNPRGQYILGVMYFNGDGMTKDESKGAKWFRKAAENGLADAQQVYANCLKDARGVEIDRIQAIKWDRKAAMQGHVIAQHNLGASYYLGSGTSKNLPEAVKWFRLAAQQGNSDAQTALGACLANGEGVTRDRTEAQKWFRKAAEQGDRQAMSALEQLEKIDKADDDYLKKIQRQIAEQNTKNNAAERSGKSTESTIDEDCVRACMNAGMSRTRAEAQCKGKNADSFNRAVKEAEKIFGH